MPFIITRTVLENLIEGKSAAQRVAPAKIERESGPGDFSMWRMIEELPPWEQTEAAGRVPPKKKIIISNALLGILAPGAYELQLIEALIRHYDVYMWPGNMTLLRECQPVRTSREFWENVGNISPAAADNVKGALAQQSLNPDDYKVIDYKEFVDWSKKIKNPESRERTPEYMSFMTGNYSFLDREELARVNHATSGGIAIEIDKKNWNIITEVDNRKLTILRPQYARYSAKIDKLKVDADTILRFPRLSDNLPAEFDGKKLHITGEKDHKYSLILDKDVNLDELRIEKLELREFLRAIDGAVINHLYLKKTPVGSLASAHIKRLTLNDCDIPNNFILPASIQFLEITGDDFGWHKTFSWQEPLDISTLTNLQEISILSAYAFARIAGKSTSIKRLVIKSRGEFAIDLSQYPNLEEVVTDGTVEFKNNANAARIKITPPNPVKKQSGDHRLEAFDASIDKIDLDTLGGKLLIDVDKYPNLSELLISGYDEVEIIGDNSNLKKISIYQIKSLKINAAFPNLEEVTLHDIERYQGPGTCFEDFSRFKSLAYIDVIHANFANTNAPCKIEHLVLDDTDDETLRLLKSIEPSSLDITLANHPDFDTKEINSKIRKLKFRSQNGREVDLSHLTELESLEIDCLNLEKLILPKNSALKTITLKISGKLTECDFSACRELESLDIKPHAHVFMANNSSLSMLDLHQCTRLKNFSYQGKSTSAIKYRFDGCRDLRSVDIYNDAYDTKSVNVNLAGCHSLQKIVVHSRGAVNLDHISDCAALTEVSLRCANAQQTADVISEIISQTADQQHLMHLGIGYSEAGHTRPDQSAAIALQTYKNNQSKVSVYRPQDKAGVDTDTGGVPVYNGRQDAFRVTFHSQIPLDRDRYRIDIYDTIHYRNNVLNAEKDESGMQKENIPCKSFDMPLTQSFILSADKDKTTIVAHLEAAITRDKFYPLPITEPLRKGQVQIYSDPADAVDIYWNKSQQHYYFKLKDGKPPGEVKLLYRYQHTPEVDTSHLKLEVSARQLLPDDLMAGFKSRLNRPSGPFEFLFNDNLSREEKMAQLETKIAKFEAAKLTAALNANGDLDKFCALLTDGKGKGSCRHRALAFMVLAHMIDVPVKMIGNEQHQFCEVPYLNKSEIVFNRVDLGGGEALDITPDAVRKDIFNENMPQAVMPASAAPQMPAFPRTQRESEYERIIKAAITPKPLAHIQDLSPAGAELQPLIILKPGQDAFAVNKQIIQQMGPSSVRQHIYIHRPEDFMAFLRPRCYANGDFHFSGKSLLRELIQNGGVLVVNWANFTPAQLAAYSSILDREPTLLSEKVSKKLTVVGLINERTESCEAFRSRNQPYLLEKTFFTPVAAPVNPPLDPEPLKVDLFQSSNWREMLLGRQVTVDGAPVLKEGPLMDAIRQGKSLIIHNPPDDPNFRLLLYRANEERKLLYNGELVTVAPGFMVSLKKNPHENTLPNVTVATSGSLNGKRPLYLGLYNFHDCFSQLRIADERTQPGAGLLARMDPEQDVILLTENIPQHEWQRLLAHINAYYPDKKFTFVLAAEVEITDVAKSTEKTAVNDNKRVYTSNDPDTLTDNLAKELDKPLIIHVTPQMRFSDLIYEQTQTRLGNGRVQFHYLEKDVLKALRAGRSVILNGDLSPSLYLALLPYLDPQAKIYGNGAEIVVKGKLVLAMPAAARRNLTLFTDTRVDYQFDDYLRMFSDADKPAIKQIQQFYEKVMMMPHKGLGRPPPAPLDYQRLDSMLTTLKRLRPLHRHNPVKGILLYDYPKDSMEYAYANVMAKAIFDTQEKHACATYKLKQLIGRFDLASPEALRPHMWEVLNCFSGPMVKTIVEKGIVMENGHPALADEGFQLLCQLLDRRRSMINVATPKAVRDKKVEEIKILLADPDVFLIMLKGPPGVGKTHAARELLGKCYEGERDIEEWLMKGGRIIFDEANMRKPGTWDFLKGLSRDKQTVYYNGKIYEINPGRHKVIMTGNPEEYEQRYYHPLFQDYAHTVYFQKPSPDYLEQRILAPILSGSITDENQRKQLVQFMLKAADMIVEYNPYFTTSIRDLENLALRFTTLLARQNRSMDRELMLAALLKACIYEFAGAVKDPRLREQFIEELGNMIGYEYYQRSIESLIFVTPEHPLPGNKAYVVDSIDSLLMMRGRMMDGVSMPAKMKKQIILEGEAGVGKSTLFKAMIERRISEESKWQNADAVAKACERWQYVEINAGTQNAREEIIKAYYAGKIVILNEINLDPGLEELLNQLLDGNDSYLKPNEPGKPPPLSDTLSQTEREKILARTSRFMVLASQNPAGHYAGRKVTTQPTLTRSVFLSLTLDTDAERAAIARHFVAEHQHFVRAFNTIKTENPALAANMRTFFTALKEAKAREAAPSAVLKPGS